MGMVFVNTNDFPHWFVSFCNRNPYFGEDAPSWAPLWVGGKSEIPKRKKILFEDIEKMAFLRKNGAECWQVSMVLGIRYYQVSSVLKKLGMYESSSAPQWAPSWCCNKKKKIPHKASAEEIAYHCLIRKAIPIGFVQQISEAREEIISKMCEKILRKKSMKIEKENFGVYNGRKQQVALEIMALRYFALIQRNEDNPQIMNEINRIVHYNLTVFENFILSRAKKMLALGQGAVDLADLVQAGKRGVLECLSRWDPNCGKFSRKMVALIIQRCMLQELENHRLISLPERIRYGIRVLRKGENLEDQNFSLKEIERCQEFEKWGTIHLPLVSIHADPNEEDNNSHEKVETEIWLNSNGSHHVEFLHEDLSVAIQTVLNEKEKEAVKHYYGFNGEPKTLEQIGNIQGVSKEMVRQRLERSKKKLRNFFEAKGMKSLGHFLN